MPSNHLIALIRCAPPSAESERLHAWLEDHACRSGLLFFQADGVEHAALPVILGGLDTERFRMQVCEGSWRRRFENDPPAAFAIGSLIDLFAQLDDDRVQLECFSASA